MRVNLIDNNYKVLTGLNFHEMSDNLMSKFVNSCTKFLGEFVGGLWKRLPYRLRLRLIRITQKKFTASVAVIITNRQGKVLLLEHLLRPGSGWGIPGGFIEHGEQPETAVRRELREETGIELENIKLYRIRTLNRHIEFMFRAESDDEARVNSREIKSLGWFAVDEMPAEMPEPQKIIVEKVLKGEI